MTQPAPRIARQTPAVLLGLTALGVTFALAVVGIAFRPPLPVDETRYLSIALEMYRSGAFLVPHKNGLTYADKPPMLFWLIDLVWAAGGLRETLGRMVAPMFAVLTVALTWRLGRVLWPDHPRAGAQAALVLSSLLVFAVLGGLTMFDSLLAAATLGGALALIRALDRNRARDWAVYGACIGFGVLAKGPVILIHMTPVLILASLWRPVPGMRDRLRGAAIALAVAVLMVALWLVPALIMGDPAWRRAVLWDQSAGRMAQSFDHARPVWWYLAALPLLGFPWLWMGAGWRAMLRRPDDGVRFCLIWFGAAFAAFSMISGKQLHYLLPDLPALALILGRGMAGPDRRIGRAPALLAVAGLGIAMMLAGLGVIPVGGGVAAALVSPGYAPVICGAMAVLLAVFAASYGRNLAALALGPGLVLVLNIWIAMSGAGALYDGGRIGAVLRQAEPGGLAVMGDYDAQFGFAGRLQSPLARVEPSDLAAWAAAHPQGAILARGDRCDRPGWQAQSMDFAGQVWGVWRVAGAPDHLPVIPCS